MNYNGNVIVEAPLYIYWKIRQLKLLTFAFFLWLCFRFNLLFLPFYFHVMHPKENEDLIDKYIKSIQYGFNVLLHWRKLLFLLSLNETTFRKLFYKLFPNLKDKRYRILFCKIQLKHFTNECILRCKTIDIFVPLTSLSFKL